MRHASQMKPPERALPWRNGTLIVNTPLGQITIRVGLHDRHGRAVEAVGIIASPAFGRGPTVVRRDNRIVELKS